MGRGIAQVFAQAGFEVTVYDVIPALAVQAKQEIEKTLQVLVDKKKITEQGKNRIAGPHQAGSTCRRTERRFNN